MLKTQACSQSEEEWPLELLSIFVRLLSELRVDLQQMFIS